MRSTWGIAHVPARLAKDRKKAFRYGSEVACSLYRKLGATSRSQAITRSRQLTLLGGP
jgi:hypothetical protein